MFLIPSWWYGGSNRLNGLRETISKLSKSVLRRTANTNRRHLWCGPQPNTVDEGAFQHLSFLAFTFPGQKEAKFIHFEEAVGFKHNGFLLKKKGGLICMTHTVLNLKMQITFSLQTRENEKSHFCILNWMTTFLSLECFHSENFLHSHLYWETDQFYAASSSRIALRTQHMDVLKFTEKKFL